MTVNRRWYDQDPMLKEAMELLEISPEGDKDEAADYILELQEQVAGDVIERLYQTVTKYQDKGGRWYDSDPVMMKAIEMLRMAPPNVQKQAAKKLLNVLSREEPLLEAD